MDYWATDALAEVYRGHRQGLFSLALSITGCRQRAEDAVHDAFVRLCARSQAPQGDLTAYVFAAVRNAARDSVRRTARGSRAAESIFNGQLGAGQADGESPVQHVLTAERDSILRAAIESLSEPEREAVVLKALAGLTFEQAGLVLSESHKTVATRYRRALARLHQRLRGRL